MHLLVILMHLLRGERLSQILYLLEKMPFSCLERFTFTFFSSCCGEWSNCLLIESSISHYDLSFLAIKEQAVLQLTTSFFLKFPEQQGVRLLSS